MADKDLRIASLEKLLASAKSRHDELEARIKALEVSNELLRMENECKEQSYHHVVIQNEQMDNCIAGMGLTIEQQKEWLNGWSIKYNEQVVASEQLKSENAHLKQAIYDTGMLNKERVENLERTVKLLKQQLSMEKIECGELRIKLNASDSKELVQSGLIKNLERTCEEKTEEYASLKKRYYEMRDRCDEARSSSGCKKRKFEEASKKSHEVIVGKESVFLYSGECNIFKSHENMFDHIDKTLHCFTMNPQSPYWQRKKDMFVIFNDNPWLQICYITTIGKFVVRVDGEPWCVSSLKEPSNFKSTVCNISNCNLANCKYYHEYKHDRLGTMSHNRITTWSAESVISDIKSMKSKGLFSAYRETDRISIAQILVQKKIVEWGVATKSGLRSRLE